MNKRLYRSSTNRMLGGICGGLADYTGIDATFIRIFIILMAAVNGIISLIYLLLWILLPSSTQQSDSGASAGFDSSDFGDKARNMKRELQNAVSKPDPGFIKYVGVGFILMGILAIIRSLDITWFRWLDSDILFPFILIVGGLFLLWRTLTK